MSYESHPSLVVESSDNLQPARDPSGHWRTLPLSGALIWKDGDVYIIELGLNRHACASLWRTLENMKQQVPS
jgi:hypothetical protein